MRATRGRLSRYELIGTISKVGFSSGHRFVVGHWESSPVGPLNDVMWAHFGGRAGTPSTSQPVKPRIGSLDPFRQIPIWLMERVKGRDKARIKAQLRVCPSSTEGVFPLQRRWPRASCG